MTLKHLSILFLLTASMPLEMSAQSTFRDAFEFGAGPSAGLYTVKGKETKALASASGSNCYLRFTHFLKSGLGFYGEIRSILVNSNEIQYFGALNKADGGQYRYRFNNGYYDLEYDPLFSIGGSYRMEYGSLGLVLRAGAGYANRYNDFSYERQMRDGSKGPEYVSVSVAEEPGRIDYLLESSAYRYTWYARAVTMSVGSQLVWQMKRRLYCFGEFSFDFSPCHYYADVTSIGSKTEYDPQNWVEAVSYYDLKDAWSIDYSSKRVSREKYGMGTHFNFSVGIGVNCGKRQRQRP